MLIEEEWFSFDIYRLAIGCPPRLVERVEGLSVAKGRMTEPAAQTPGRYCLWNYYSRQVLQSIDTNPET